MIEFSCNKPDGMSNEEYLKQLYLNKSKLGLSWRDIADKMNCLEDKNYSEDRYRKMCKKFSEEEFIENSVEEETVDKKLELYYATQAFKDERSQLNTIYRQISRENEIKNIAIECAKIIAESNPFEFKEEVIDVESEKEAILQISDWHYGIEIDNCFNRYNPEICKSRLVTLLSEVINYCSANKVKKINVVNLGDMISGRIHSQIRIENKEDVISQVINVSELIANFLLALSKRYVVDYYDCLDNHSRIEPNKKESLRLESLARITNWFLEYRFENNTRVNIKKNKYSDDIILFDVLGHTVAGVHGDLDSQKTVIKNLQTFTGNQIDLVCTAHMHHFSSNDENDCMLICNPSLMGMDSFAESKRLYSKPAQNLIIATRDNVAESIHRIIL